MLFAVETHCDGRDFQKRTFHCRGDRAGVVDVYSRVGSVVYTGNEQVYRALVQLHCRQLDAIGGGAPDAVTCELAVDVDPVANQRLGKGNAMAGARLAVGWRNHRNIPNADQLFINSRKAGRENAIIICQ